MRKAKGFTILELIIYLAIVSVMLVSIAYLMIDIMGGQNKDAAGEEVNANLRFISQVMSKDIRSAGDITDLSNSTLALATAGDTISYHFDDVTQAITRQVGGGPINRINTNAVSISGEFFDRSYLNRTRNVEVQLILRYRYQQPGQSATASSTADFAVELRGRR